MPFENLPSLFLQDLIKCVAIVSKKRIKILMRKLLEECFAPADKIKCEDEQKPVVLSCFECEPCVRLVLNSPEIFFKLPKKFCHFFFQISLKFALQVL